MDTLNKHSDSVKIDQKEFELPKTALVRDIENRVFQGIVLQCLAKIKGIGLIEGNFIDSIFGRDSLEAFRGIHADQDNKHQCVSFRIEVNICYGLSIPEKAEEIQTKIAEEATKLTGLHVSSIHVIFKNIIPVEQMKTISDIINQVATTTPLCSNEVEYKDNSASQ